jgi:hypothetical protein
VDDIEPLTDAGESCWKPFKLLAMRPVPGGRDRSYCRAAVLKAILSGRRGLGNWRRSGINLRGPLYLVILVDSTGVGCRQFDWNPAGSRTALTSAGRPSPATPSSTRRPSSEPPRRPSPATFPGGRREFGEATFTGDAWFPGDLHRHAEFGEAAFAGGAEFDQRRRLRPAAPLFVEAAFTGARPSFPGRPSGAAGVSTEATFTGDRLRFRKSEPRPSPATPVRRRRADSPGDLHRRRRVQGRWLTD